MKRLKLAAVALGVMMAGTVSVMVQANADAGKSPPQLTAEETVSFINGKIQFLTPRWCNDLYPTGNCRLDTGTWYGGRRGRYMNVYRYLRRSGQTFHFDPLTGVIGLTYVVDCVWEQYQNPTALQKRQRVLDCAKNTQGLLPDWSAPDMQSASSASVHDLERIEAGEDKFESWIAIYCKKGKRCVRNVLGGVNKDESENFMLVRIPLSAEPNVPGKVQRALEYLLKVGRKEAGTKKDKEPF